MSCVFCLSPFRKLLTTAPCVACPSRETPSSPTTSPSIPSAWNASSAVTPSAVSVPSSHSKTSPSVNGTTRHVRVCDHFSSRIFFPAIVHNSLNLWPGAKISHFSYFGICSKLRRNAPSAEKPRPGLTTRWTTSSTARIVTSPNASVVLAATTRWPGRWWGSRGRPTTRTASRVSSARRTWSTCPSSATTNSRSTAPMTTTSASVGYLNYLNDNLIGFYGFLILKFDWRLQKREKWPNFDPKLGSRNVISRLPF